jgi:predicted dehydrogenase
MSELHVVIVGAGRAGTDLHLGAFQAQPDVRVVAICDVDLERARQVAKRRGIEHAYASLAEALESHRVDVVSVCSPPQAHLAQSVEAMEAGADVLVEKPITMSPAEADALEAQRVKTNRKLCVVHNYKFQRGAQQVINAVAQGQVGKIIHVERTWLRNGSDDRMISDPGCWCHALPGGRWGETLAHDIYIPYQFQGALEVQTVEARKTGNQWPWLPADEVFVRLEGQRGDLTIRYSSNVETTLYKFMTVYGSKGVLMTDGMSLIRVSGGSPIRQFVASGKALARFGVGKMKGAAKRVSSRAPNVAAGTGHLTLITRFVKFIRDEGDSPVSWDEAYSTMCLVDQIGRKIDQAAGV